MEPKRKITSEIGAVFEHSHGSAVFQSYENVSRLQEEHPCSHCVRGNDDVSRLIELAPEPAHNVSHDVGVSICKKRNFTNERSAIMSEYLLE